MRSAVVVRDYPLIQGIFLVLAIGVMSANMLADLTYKYLDPRTRPAASSKHVTIQLPAKVQKGETL